MRRPVSWQEFQKVCLKLGCVVSRQHGSHIMMTRPAMARPVVIPRKKQLSPGVISSNCRTLGITTAKLEELLDSL